MKRVAVLVLLLASVSVLAQQPASQAASAEDIQRLVDAMHLKQQLVQMQGTILAQYKPMVEKMAADRLKELTPQQRQRFQDMMTEMLAESLHSYPPEEMVSDVIPIYQKYLDKADVEASIAFYSSPTGQKFLNNQPKIMAEFMSSVMPKIQERVQAATQKMQERLRALLSETQSHSGHEPDPNAATPPPK